MNYTRDLILSVRELLDRHLDVIEIANRLHLDPDDIRIMIDIINNILS